MARPDDSARRHEPWPSGADTHRHKFVRSEQHVRSLIRRLVTAQEDERSRIARNLHDEMGQQVTALRLTLERVEQQVGPCAELTRAHAIVREMDDAIDFLSWELRPALLDDLGLVAALPRYVTSWSEHYGIGAEFRACGIERARLSPEAETAYYRIAQEALTNVARHAHATRVSVLLEYRDHTLVLIIEDDGIGFDAAGTEREGLGLVGMRERAELISGRLEIESAPSQGTTVYVRLPLASQGEVK